jgi:hypothetical protein
MELVYPHDYRRWSRGGQLFLLTWDVKDSSTSVGFGRFSSGKEASDEVPTILHHRRFHFKILQMSTI